MTVAAPLVQPELLSGIITDVFVLMAKLPIQSKSSQEAGEPEGIKVTALVTMSGRPGSPEPNYRVLLEVPERLALKIATSMLQQPILQWSSDVEDACGEVVNMIGGNLKKHLVATHVLSMPAVIHGADFQCSLAHITFEQSAAFVCGPDPFRVYLGKEIPKK